MSDLKKKKHVKICFNLSVPKQLSNEGNLTPVNQQCDVTFNRCTSRSALWISWPINAKFGAPSTVKHLLNARNNYEKNRERDFTRKKLGHFACLSRRIYGCPFFHFLRASSDKPHNRLRHQNLDHLHSPLIWRGWSTQFSCLSTSMEVI